MPLVATWDYPNRRIVLDASTMNTDIDTLDVYREERAARRDIENYRKYPTMTEGFGGFAKVVGVSQFPAAFRLRLGARLVPYNASHSLRVTRDSFTDDGLVGRNCFDRTSLSVGVAVDIDFDFPEIEIRLVATGGSGSGLTQQQVRDAMKLAASGGTPAAGSVDAKLNGIGNNTVLIPALL